MRMRTLGLTLLLIPVLALSAEAHKPNPRLRPHGAHKNHPMTLDAAAINNPIQPQIERGAKGSAVVRAQILLDRAHFSCGEIDASFGSNFQKTVAAYQDDRKLPVTNSVDDATWAALNADTAPALVSVTIAPEDEAGPFQELPKDLMKQASLPSLGYASPLEELAERFHASPALLQALNPGADFTKIGQQLNVPNTITMPPGKAEMIVVSKSESSVRASGADGKLLAFYIATLGSEHDPLPIGTWEINGVQRNPVFHYNAQLFWDAHDPNEKAEIKPGPRNPVGLVWIDVSKQHYGIHGTPTPSQIGHASSHGCIRLTNWDALELASMVKKGTQVALKE
jgi:lipoprotein-anchoring transpeptidase ErfK/SrfK